MQKEECRYLQQINDTKSERIEGNQQKIDRSLKANWKLKKTSGWVFIKFGSRIV